MAVTIVRTPWIDDDGSGTTGTVLNNAIKTELYSQIDGALAQLVASNGLLNITAFGVHQITAGGTGGQALEVRNTAAGTGNWARLSLGNDLAADCGVLQVYSTTNNFGAPYLPSALAVRAIQSGGLSLVAEHGSGAIRFYTGGTTQRAQFNPAGSLFIGSGTDILAARTEGVHIVMNPSSSEGLTVTVSADLAGGTFVDFKNAAAASQGRISATNATTTAYNTTSDQRLKDDLGVAEDLTALRAVVVHDFVWSAHGGHDRGVFAQETFPVFPRAISVGSPGTDLSKPWMTDYSKFVPDLIVGWQEHDRRLARLESLVSEKD